MIKIKLKFLNRNPPIEKEPSTESIKMISEQGSYFQMWNGELYKSDVIRACIRPKAKAIGKLMPKHIIDDGENIKIQKKANIYFLLEEPNKLMTNQVMFEKIIVQLQLNNNAFIAIHRNENGIPIELIPINCIKVEAKKRNNELYLVFTLKNGEDVTYSYNDIIHIRQDLNDNEIFGESPLDTLKPLMEIVNTTDQGIVNAIRNSSIIKWLLEFKQTLREEDMISHIKKFAKNFLDVDSETGGVAAADPRYSAKQVEQKDYVPNATQMDKTTQRLYSFFNTNDKIVQSKYGEDDWNAYHESEIEPIALQLSMEYTRKIFNRKQRFSGERIVWESTNLQYASMNTKLNLERMVDRGAMSANTWLKILNLPPVEGGDKLVRRLDTAPIKANEGGEGDE